MPNTFTRPTIPYVSQNLVNNDRYQLLGEGSRPVSGDALDGDINYLIYAINFTYDYALTVSAGIIPDSALETSIGKFPVTNGQNPATITWSKILPIHFSAQCIPTSAFQNGCITTDAYANASITSSKLQSDTVNDSVILDGKISFDKITPEASGNFRTFFNLQTDESLNGSKIAPGSLSGTAITQNTLPSASLVNNSLTRAQLSALIQPLIGKIEFWAGGSAVAVPAGYLRCSGQLVLKATYPELYAAIGDTYGAGTATQFMLPDWRGRTIYGFDPTQVGNARTGGRVINGTLALGSYSGSETHTLTVPETPPHTHAYTNWKPGANPLTAGIGASTDIENLQTSSVGGGLPHNNMPPYGFSQVLIYAGV